jgi:hypothetical protein
MPYGLEVFRVTFEARGEFIPTNPGGGVSDTVASAAFAGAFVVVPA